MTGRVKRAKKKREIKRKTPEGKFCVGERDIASEKHKEEDLQREAA